jgi:hypothetical protein
VRVLAAALLLGALAWITVTASAAEIYPDPWSATAMLGTQVRGLDKRPIGRVDDLIVDEHGSVRTLIVRASSTLGIGAHAYAVPWDEVRLMPALAYLQVPFTRDNAGDYEVSADRKPESLDGPGAWRVSRLLHEHANLRDVPDIGFVHDALFTASGEITKVIVSNFFESYAYPFYGYREGAGGYALPYAASQMDGLAPASKATARAAPTTRRPARAGISP